MNNINLGMGMGNLRRCSEYPEIGPEKVLETKLVSCFSNHLV